MIDLTRLVRGIDNRPEEMKYERTHDDEPLVPLVVWNATQACNLSCKHCYFGAIDERSEAEFSTAEVKTFIDDLAEMNVPVFVFSGGEPFVREDIAELTAYARDQGLRAIASSNGTFLSEQRAQEVADAGMSYVGISLDGVGETHDKFRGLKGSFDRAVEGIKNAQAAGMGVGIRSTMTQETIDDLPDIVDLSLDLGVDRLNVFHLIYTGSAVNIVDNDLSFEQSREMVDYLYERTIEIADTNPDMQLLTAGNYCDAIYLYHRICEEIPEHADRARELLFDDGPGRVVKKGDAGPKVVNVDHEGNVHPSMFLPNITLGNVRETSLDTILAESDIWDKLANPEDHLKGRCGECSYKSVCGGNSRARAYAVNGDLFAEEPRCYLSDAEIGIESDADVPSPPEDVVIQTGGT